MHAVFIHVYTIYMHVVSNSLHILILSLVPSAAAVPVCGLRET